MTQAVLITGGAGFIGSHLCERLLGEGHAVTALDNLFTGRKQNLAPLQGHPRFRFVEHDVRRPFPADLGPCARLYHLACPASPPHYQRDPIFTLETSFLGTQQALAFAAQQGARMLQASTSEVYGDPEVHPQAEDYRGAVNPTGPRACYDEGKRVAETLCADLRRQGRVDVRIARIFNTYGPRMDPKDGRVVSNFIMQALRGEAITVYGDGQQTRSFCYVADLVQGLCLLMEHPDESGPVNLGNDREMTMLELAQQVQAQVGSSPELHFEALPEDDPLRRRPDLTRARRVLGYAPHHALADGLAQTVAYFRQQLQAV
ncbi:MAG: UDP-glucuronic acid decarboxylase family protein [Polyangiales bacterium]